MTSLSLLFLALFTAFASAKQAHFTVELVPKFHPLQETMCSSEDENHISAAIAQVIRSDTRFEHQEAIVETVTFIANDSKGFDFTYDCPEFCPGNNDWCRVMCVNNIKTLGDDLVEALSHDIRRKLKQELKSHGSLFNVKCLGDSNELEVHLIVGVSPYTEAEE